MKPTAKPTTGPIPAPSDARCDAVGAATSASAPSSAVNSPHCGDESVGYLLARVRSTMSGELQRLTQTGFEMSSTQASMLMMLKHGPKSGADLAREYGLDASAVTRLLDKLETRGLVTRSRSASDRRVVHVALTTDGWACVDRLRPLYTQVLERMLAGFSEEEAGFLKNVLKRIIFNCHNETGK